MTPSLSFGKLALVGSCSPAPSVMAALRQMQRSIAVATVGDDNDPNGAHGTAMCVHPLGLFLTARHFVDRPDVRLVLDRPYAAEVVAVDDERDFALMALREFPADLVKPVSFAAGFIGSGTAIAGVGHVIKDGGYELALYGASYVSPLRDAVQPEDRESMPADWLDCALMFEGEQLLVPGFSGGPMLLPTGEVAALTSFGDGNNIVVGPSGAAAAAFVSWFTDGHANW